MCNTTGFSFPRVRAYSFTPFFSPIKDNKAFPITWFWCFLCSDYDTGPASSVCETDPLACSDCMHMRLLIAHNTTTSPQNRKRDGDSKRGGERERQNNRKGEREMGERGRERHREGKGYVYMYGTRAHTHSCTRSLRRGAPSRGSTNGWKRNVNKQVALYPNQIAGGGGG